MFAIRPAQLVVVRHGQSLRNEYLRGHLFLSPEAKKELPYGDHQVPLTDRGRAQAGVLGKFLATKEYRFDAAYHSDQLRAQDSLDSILTAMGQQPRPEIFRDTRLRERSPGYLYGLTGKEVAHQFPWFQSYWEQAGWFYARPVGGESLADLYEGRVRQALSDIFDRHRTEHLLIVCHGRTQQVIRLLLDDVPVNTNMRPFGALDNCGTVVWKGSDEAGQVIYP